VSTPVHYCLFAIMIFFVVQVISLVKLGTESEVQWLSLDRACQDPPTLKRILNGEAGSSELETQFAHCLPSVARKRRKLHTEDQVMSQEREEADRRTSANCSPARTVHQRELFTSANCSPARTVHQRELFTSANCSAARTVHQRLLCALCSHRPPLTSAFFAPSIRTAPRSHLHAPRFCSTSSAKSSSRTARSTPPSPPSATPTKSPAILTTAGTCPCAWARPSRRSWRSA